MSGLHINSYFFTNRIHYFFKRYLERASLQKPVFFIPVYKHASKQFDAEGIVYYNLYGRLDRKLFFTKIIKSTLAIRKQFDSKEYLYIHAHTLISDGLIALILSLIYSKPFIVTVRNTDLNVFLPNKVFRFLGEIVLNRTSAVMYLSPVYQKEMLVRFPKLRNKPTFVLPSGLDPFWQHNLYSGTRKGNLDKVKLLFVGRIDTNKNIEILLDFVRRYNDRMYELHVAGENVRGINFEKISSNLENELGNKVVYRGVLDREMLLECYRECDLFIMLSLNESFGISYIEALSQGLPIIYTRGQGVDGVFNEGEVGFSCDPRDLSELKEKVDAIIGQYAHFQSNAEMIAPRFRWESIVDEYLEKCKFLTPPETIRRY